MGRFRNKNWNVGGEEKDDGTIVTWPNTEAGRNLAVLMDIRDELRTLRQIFTCNNFTALPKIVKQIRTHTGRIPVRKRKPK